MVKNKKIKILAIALFATASIYAAAPVGGYLPGATTDPDCVPGVDTDCTVKMAGMFTEGVNSGDAVYTEGNIGIGTNDPKGRLDVNYNKRYRISEPFNRQTTPQTPLCASDLDSTKRDVIKMEPTENVGDRCFDSFTNADGSITYYQEYEVINISNEPRLSVGPNFTELKNSLTIANKNDRFGNTLSMESLNKEPVYMNFMHEPNGVEDDLKRYLYIQAGDFGPYSTVRMGTNATTPINMVTYDNGVAISKGVVLPEAGLDVSSLAHKFDVGTGNCPAGWTEGDYDGEADDADCLSPNGLLVRNGNMGIGTSDPKGRLDITATKIFKKVEGLNTDPGLNYCDFDLNENITEYYNASPYNKDLGYQCVDRDLDHPTSKYNVVEVTDKFWHNINYTNIQPNVSQCSFDNDLTKPDVPPIPTNSEIGNECYDTRGTYYNHYVAVKISDIEGITVLENGTVNIGKGTPEKKIKNSGKLNVSGNISIQSYSPSLILQRNVNYGGFTQGIQTRLEDGTDNWWFGALGEGQFRISKGNYAGVKFNILENGNVGIGVTSPSSKLAVSGLPSGTTDSVANGNLVGAVCITNTGNMYIDTDGSCAN